MCLKTGLHEEAAGFLSWVRNLQLFILRSLFDYFNYLQVKSESVGVNVTEQTLYLQLKRMTKYNT